MLYSYADYKITTRMKVMSSHNTQSIKITSHARDTYASDYLIN